MTTIFLELVDRDTEEISIKDFVEYLDGMKVEMPKDKLYKIMRTLDTDGSGTISLDEFLNFFGMVKNEEDEKAKAEEEMLL
jgi:Ca2+-binding EF-hand superfamily protein